MLKTAFFWDEKCFWHGGGNYAQLAPVGGLVQPMVAGGLPEAPETKRRLKNLMDVTGLSAELICQSAPAASDADLGLVHPESYLSKFHALSAGAGGELGLRTPFGPGAYAIAALSTGLVIAAVEGVLQGQYRNAYALSRPPGHHCLPDWPNGFCLFANIAVAIRAARAKGLCKRVAVLDWDVHHGNGTEAIFWDDPDVLTISIHQEHCYPPDTGGVEAIGGDGARGANMNIPLPPGVGHDGYLEVMDRIVLPKLRAFDADLVIVACGYDAAFVDPLSRMLCSVETFRAMTARVMEVTGGRFVAAHEGGYSEMYVPFCGHAVLAEMAGSAIDAPDPLAARVLNQQPNARMRAFHSQLIGEMAAEFGLA